MERVIGHLNYIGFRSAVAALMDSGLRGRPYVIAGDRALAWDVSPEALRQNIRSGMALAAAKRMVRDLIIVPPNPKAYAEVNNKLEKYISRYAPAWQNDGAGNIYLDITGTRRLFGPPKDCIHHLQKEIAHNLHIEAAAAAAPNKLVSKVASRVIRPEGLIEVCPGDEAAFLFHQHIALLPGLDPSLLKTIQITGFREAGELAALSDAEAAALFGKKGLVLRDTARGIDNAPVRAGMSRIIEKRVDFAEDTIDETIIQGALAALAEEGGLEMRKDKLSAGSLSLEVLYSDGVIAKGNEEAKQLFVLDSEIMTAVLGLYKKTLNRRIRIRSLSFALENLSPFSFTSELFESEEDTKKRHFQEAIDSLQGRYGAGTLMRGVVLAASAIFPNFYRSDYDQSTL
jgi:DNA polymerase-4